MNRFPALAAAFVAAFFICGTDAGAAIDGETLCRVKKLTACARRTKAELGCHAKAMRKGAAVDQSCLDKAATKFGKAMTKAEARTACGRPGTAATAGAKIDAYTAATLAAVPGTAKCSQTKLKATAKTAMKLLKAVAKNDKKPSVARFSRGFAKAKAALVRVFAKADAKGGCQVTGDGVAMVDATDAFVENLVDLPAPDCPAQLLYGSEGNRLRRYDVDTIGSGNQLDDILIERAAIDPNGRDINGQICAIPGGGFVAGEDTGQPHPPAGWGVFDADGDQVGKLTPTYQAGHDPPEPFGCSVGPGGHLFTSSLGNQASGAFTGQLIMWFPPYDGFPGQPGEYPGTDATSQNFCKLATNLGTAGSVTTDSGGNVYVTAARSLTVWKFAPPFPTSADGAGGCGATDATGSPAADEVDVSVFVGAANVGTATGIVQAAGGNFYVAGVLTGLIAEFTPGGDFVRQILEPPAGETELPLSTGHPQGLAIDCKGNLYFADMALVNDNGNLGPGPDGKVRRISFDLAGNTKKVEVVKSGLAYPDGLGIMPGDLEGN